MRAVLDVVLPVFALMVCGYGFRRGGLLSAEAVRGIGAFVFNLAIPTLLFRSMATGLAGPSAGGSLSWALPAAYFGACAAVFLIALPVGRFALRLHADECVVMAMGAAFSNVVMLGLPLVGLAYGPPGIVLTVLLIAFHSPLLIGTATLLVEVARGRGAAAGAALAATVSALIRNPILVGLALGALWAAAGVELPRPAARFVDLLAAAAAPTALFALGASLTEFRIAGDLRDSLIGVALKLLLHPLLAWLLAAVVFQLPPLEVRVAVLCAALPVGANVFLLAQRYDVYTRRAASVTVISTVASVAVLALVLALFGTG